MITTETAEQMPSSAPKPAPPGPAFHLSRALVRDARLTPEEQAFKVRALEEARKAVQTAEVALPPVPRESGGTPGQQAAAYAPRLENAGWQVDVFDHPVRGRLEAFHPSGASVMITVDHRRRKKRNRPTLYILHPPGTGSWRHAPQAMLDYFTTHQKLPPGVGGPRVSSKCRCGKEGMYPTLRAASAALSEIGPKRKAGKGEARCYRCSFDDRVWHLTSKWNGYADSIPLALAFRPGANP
ncbi:hypothetical protein ABZS76_32735 [Streptomyces sp. NPDC005562]|uniref:hypothetical protein n=1 Tax=Streptomyces sp. NPDC005562 TaxID=3154890 RepID=UPI0033A2DACD